MGKFSEMLIGIQEGCLNENETEYLKEHDPESLERARINKLVRATEKQISSTVAKLSKDII